MLQEIQTTGTLIEYSKSYLKDKEGTFGVIEMSGIRLVGSFSIDNLKEGIKVKMSSCGIRPDGSVFYDFVKA